MTLDAIEPGLGGATTPAAAVHKFTKEEIEERRKQEVNDDGK